MAVNAYVLSAALLAGTFSGAAQAQTDLATVGVMRHVGVCMTGDPVSKKMNYYGLVMSPFGDSDKPLQVPEEMLRRQKAAYERTLQSLPATAGTSRVFAEAQLREFKTAIGVIDKHRATQKPALQFCGTTV